MIRAQILAIAILGLLSKETYATVAFGSGNGWTEICSQSGNPSAFAFASGVAGGMTWFDKLHPICLRAGVTRAQIGAVFCSYLFRHPEQWDDTDVLIAGKALEEAFPCSQ